MDNIKAFISEKKLGEFSDTMTFSQISSLQVGGPIDLFVSIGSIPSFIELYKYLRLLKIEVLVIGRGTNILASSKRFKGVVISLDKMEKKMEFDDGIFEVSANQRLAVFSRFVAKKGYVHSEFMSGIPGSIGGGVYMNAGAYKKEIKDVLIDATFVTQRGEIVTLKNEELRFGYRYSLLQDIKSLKCISARFQFPKESEPGEAMERIERWGQNRKDSQPYDTINAGSTFRNPKEILSWKVIDQAGLRGYQIGGAQVSTKHANFIINTGNATAEDLYELVQYVKKRVYEVSNIVLETEWELINWG